jgi:two-component system sensor histidine kinase UhpB
MGGAETRALIGGFNSMLDRLQAERRASTRRTVATLEGERQRISRELHDEIGQRLTGVLLQLDRIHDEASDPARPHIVAVQDETRAVMDEVGALAWWIRPAILDDLALLSALTSLTASLTEITAPHASRACSHPDCPP